MKAMIAAMALLTIPAITAAQSGREVEVEFDENCCYVVPDECFELKIGWKKGKFWASVYGKCEGLRHLYRMCFEGKGLTPGTVGPSFIHYTVMGHTDTYHDDYYCIWADRANPDNRDRFFMSKRNPGWSYFNMASSSPARKPTGRVYLHVIGSQNWKNDALCVGDALEATPDFSKAEQ